MLVLSQSEKGIEKYTKISPLNVITVWTIFLSLLSTSLDCCTSQYF